MDLSIAKARSYVNVRHLKVLIYRMPSLALFLALVSGLALPLCAETVYLRNQRLPVVQANGAQMVQVDAFLAIIERLGEATFEPTEGILRVTKPDGDKRSFVVTPYGELQEWESLLGWLGYEKRVNQATGTVDYAPPGVAAVATPATATEGISAETRREQSQRRPGYRLAEKNFETIMSQLTQGGTEEQRRRVRELGGRVAAQSPLGNISWTFEVAKSPVPNALCTGEGFVVVTEGLLALDLTDDELAGVLGHEVAHGVRRHALLFEERFEEARRLVVEYDHLKRDYAKAEREEDLHRLQAIRTRANTLTPRLEFLVDFLENKQAYDRHEEEEADVLGIQYAVAAGFDANGEGRALIKLRARSVELFGQAYQDGGRTHPPLARRLEILSLVQKRWQAERLR